MTLQEVLLKFKNDTSWNTNDRFKDEIIWIENMVNDYAKAFSMTPDEVITLIEQKRDYSWPNYYQRANFPDINIKDQHFIGVFKTGKEFMEKYDTFICPKCGDETPSPQECIHRHNKDGKCDWCSYGLFSGPYNVIILESGFKAIPIFKPKNYEVSHGKA